MIDDNHKDQFLLKSRVKPSFLVDKFAHGNFNLAENLRNNVASTQGVLG